MPDHSERNRNPRVRLSSPISDIKDHYTVVVIGSGYGGAISASRLARAGQEVCVLERGKEFQPGEYPDTEIEAAREFQLDSSERHVGLDTGLYDVRLNPDINVLIGCGLGGTSLINANVSLRAEPRVFEDPRWPAALREDAANASGVGLLSEGYRRAEEMLKPTPYPETFPPLRKLQALEKSGQQIQAAKTFYRPPINVTFEDGINHVGVQQHACKLCGDCCTGCNHGAKNTVLMNYLPDARNHGAKIFTEIGVRYIERRDDKWLVHYQLLDVGRASFDAPLLFVTADIVILAAGSLGSTEILLRSKANGLSVSDNLGHHFSGNGDAIGFAYNTDVEINGIGSGTGLPDPQAPVGPVITGIIDIRHQPNVNDGIVIEDGSFPGALANLLPAALAVGAELEGTDTDSGIRDATKEKLREWESFIRGPYEGATRNTQMMLVMSHDDGDAPGGVMSLVDDRIRIVWPGVGKRPIFQRIDDLMKQATAAIGGNYLPNPLWNKQFGHNLFAAHPLGGCSMSERAEEGVVNHKGQVFSGQQGPDVYEGLYVSDGSIMPCSLGVNPLLTISALAERCCALLASDRHWNIDYALNPITPVPAPPVKAGLQFTETMKGYVSRSISDDYQTAAEQGRNDNMICEFVLTITSQDLEAMLTDSSHRAAMVGTLNVTGLSDSPMTVTGGEFNLFTYDEDIVGARRMLYRMKATSEEGQTYLFTGFKLIRDDHGIDIWADTTTLYVLIYEGADETTLIAKGILKIEAADFARQMQSLQVTNAPDLIERLKYLTRYGNFFAGSLFDVYGGVFASLSVFNPDTPPRKKRPLRVGAPTVHVFKTSDNLDLRLTRYQGGSKGPVILAHGLGVSSRIFSLDTIETNLLEYLFAHGYDVWLLDYRASIDLPASKTQYSADDVASIDYPAAVKQVRELTGAASVQMVVHCFGATTFFMAMLAGLEGVRSVVCSQVATHTVIPTLSKIKVGLHMPSFLEAMRIESLTAYADTHENWANQLYDEALRLYPIQAEEYCDSPVCHRIAVMYAGLYEHEQLNRATHDTMHELFGIASIRALDHLALIMRRGHLVTMDGQESYLPNLSRLAIPIRFIHGEENVCFLPRSTEIAYDLLRETNGEALYTRQVIPKYGHIDCIFGKNAARDVYPHILSHLEVTAGRP